MLLNSGYAEWAVAGYTSTNLIAYLKNNTMVDGYGDRVLLIGINDVLTDVSAATIEANLTTLIATLHSPVVICLLPFGNYSGWTSGREAVRQTVNTWIKANVARYVDAETAMADLSTPSQPKLKASYDSGDGLHPNATGNSALADAIFAQVTLQV